MPRRASSLRSRVSRFVFAVLLLTLACAGATKADTFQNGQFVTYAQSAWVGLPTASALLAADFSSVYAPNGFVTVGLPNTGFTMTFNSPSFMLVYLPAGGSPSPLTSNVINPSTTSAGSFGGDVLALALNVDFNNAGFLKGTSNILFGNLVLTNFGSTLSGLNGLTVSQFLADANTCLGGGSCLYSISTMDTVTAQINGSFEGQPGISIPPGTPDSFALTNLALPGSVTPTPEPSSALLLAFGVLGLGIFHFKRRSSANSTPA